MNTFYLTTPDKHQTFVRSWMIEHPKAIVQIVHGMNEHSKRYNAFARFLNAQGFAVFATDHRGHGHSARNEESIGYIGDDGFTMMVDDEHMLYQHIQASIPSVPHFLLGHSMGSFITQRYIQLYGSELTGAILVGTGGPRHDLKLGAFVAGLVEKANGDKRMKTLDKVIFNGYNSRFIKKTGFEWLANDPDVVHDFITDPFCGHIFPPSFFRQFMQFMQSIFEIDEVKKVPAKLPVIILSGSNDPVGQYGKGTDKLFHLYQSIGLNNLRYKLYPNGRHEILNDYNRQEVYEDIVAWLHEQLSNNT
ncbi:alpha/beta hydrolase [Bacillus sp. AGMB 02131]|uniref:Alpha/beta hydrolase n=1 Tax=Peribacillus faecalis TaxID=2772559 RepID=A0A927HB33_9BACI|nr:alpha/beta hydrolase [Peribacillus faecalis]MBD3106988.1 alpha/beta hydrolase [Peribacillus faecalis]